MKWYTDCGESKGLFGAGDGGIMRKGGGVRYGM